MNNLLIIYIKLIKNQMQLCLKLDFWLRRIPPEGDGQTWLFVELFFKKNPRKMNIIKLLLWNVWTAAYPVIGLYTV